jgi:hypothetical protein
VLSSSTAHRRLVGPLEVADELRRPVVDRDEDDRGRTAGLDHLGDDRWDVARSSRSMPRTRSRER